MKKSKRAYPLEASPTELVLSEVLVERHLQKEKYDDDHDDLHDFKELVDCAIAILRDEESDIPWGDGRVWFQKKKHTKTGRGLLIMSIALLVAEVERLDRLCHED